MDFSPVWISLKTTACASAVTFVLGILAAWAVMFIKGRRLKAVVDGILTIPLVLPPTVAGFFLLYLFGARRPIGSFVEDVFGFRIAFSWFATVLAAVIVSFPLMYRSAKAGFEQIDQNMIEEAKMMGLGKWGILWKILFPCTFPSILGATAMLAGNIPGKTRTLPLAVYSEVAAGNMDRAWIYVAVILGVAFIAVWIMNMTAKADREIKM